MVHRQTCLKELQLCCFNEWEQNLRETQVKMILCSLTVIATNVRPSVSAQTPVPTLIYSPVMPCGSYRIKMPKAILETTVQRKSSMKQFGSSLTRFGQRTL